MNEERSEARVLGFVEALQVVLGHSATSGVPGKESVALLTSAGRVLAEDVLTDRDQPPFDRSTRDGFAVRAAEWSAGNRLRVVGQVRAGQAWAGEDLEAGCALEIMTGAPIPAGVDAVAMIEHGEQGGGEVWAAVGRSLRAGDNVVPQGSEARSGAALLPSGTMIGASEIAVAAACGRAELPVYLRPSVAIVATGDELVELSQAPQTHQIRNSNSYALAAMVEAVGGNARRLRIARDTLTDLRERISEGRRSDLMLLSGGVSAGKYDLVEDVLAESGAEFFFTGVRMQPGKPVVFGRLPKDESAKESSWTYFFGLPGNPVSTQVTFHCFVEPMLRALSGVGVAGPKFVQATLAEDVKAKAGLTRVLPAFLRHDLQRPEVRLVGWQGSGDLAANSRANCYAVLPDGQESQTGDVITVLLR